MFNHDFIFNARTWLGEGKIAIRHSPEFIKFYTKWVVDSECNGIIKAVQTVEMVGVKEKTINHFTFHEISETSFRTLLENEHVGKATGVGFLNEEVLSWEFTDKTTLQGTETYKKLEDGSYSVYAQYGTDKDYQTLIEGLIRTTTR